MPQPFVLLKRSLSFASGWHATDFVLRPENYADRKSVTVETMDTVRRLWRGEEVSHRGHVTVDRARLWSLPEVPPELVAGAVSAETAGCVSSFVSAGSTGATVVSAASGARNDRNRAAAIRRTCIVVTL